MLFVRLIYENGYYDYEDSNDIKMDILGFFLKSDVGCRRSSFKEWGLDDSDIRTNSNITYLEKENGYIYLSDLYSEEKVPTRLKMSIKQFVQILDDWDTKVCKVRPQEVIIKYENGEYSIETKNG